MLFVFIICIIGMVIISFWDKRRGVKSNGLEVDRKMFAMSPGFATGALIILGLLAALYTLLW